MAQNQSDSTPGSAPGPIPGAPQPHAPGGLFGQAAQALEDLEEKDTLHPVLQWIVKHAKPLGYGLVAVLAVVAGLAYWEHRQDAAREEAAAQLAAILQEEDAAARAEALEAFAAQTPDSLRAAVMLEQARTYMEASRYAEAADAWRDAANAAEGPMGLVAAMGEARARMEQGEYASALEVLEGALARSAEPFQRPLNRMIAQAAESAGEYARAATALRAVKGESGQGEGAFIDAKIARLEVRAQTAAPAAAPEAEAAPADEAGPTTPDDPAAASNATS